MPRFPVSLPKGSSLSLAPSLSHCLPSYPNSTSSSSSPFFFLFLTAIQPFIVAWLADVFGVPRAVGLLPIASHAAMFAVSHFIIHTDKFFDITGETTFFPLILWSHYHTAGAEASERQRLLTGVALLWCARLGLFLGIRIFIRGSDFTASVGSYGVTR